MSRKEVVAHLLSEIQTYEQRVRTKALLEAKKMNKTHKKIHTYQQRIGSNTLLTVYIYGIDKKGVDFTNGCWFETENGLNWASVGQNGVDFYSAHFFKRYAERYLKQQMSIHQAAVQFYSNYQFSKPRKGEQVNNGVYKVQLPLSDGGLALGFHDPQNHFTTYNTYVSSDLLGSSQVQQIEDDRELNEALRDLLKLQYNWLTDAMK